MQIPGKKQTPSFPSSSPVPSMPGGGNEDDLEIELTIAPPPPMLKPGDYEAILSRIEIFRNEDGSPKNPMFELEIVDPKEKAKLDKGEPSNYGDTATFNYTLNASASIRRMNDELIAGLGYPPASWPTTDDGRVSFGKLIKLIRAEMITEPKHARPRVIITIKVNPGKGENKDRVFVNVSKIKRLKAK